VTHSESADLLITIGDEQDGKRIDAVLAKASGMSRSHIQQLLKQGHVSNKTGTVISQLALKVREYEQYHITIPPTQALNLEPEDIPLDILFEDEHLIVINKPAGMVVHPSHGHDTGTLVHALLHHCDSLPGINGMERPGIVHRLDKDTSGSLVVAKTEAAHHRLSEMFASHDLDRQYVAWCRGVPRWRVKRIEEPIGRHPQHRQKMAVNMNGKTAITDASLEHIYGGFSKLRLRLHTGRTHQIRVHLAHEQVPVLGDPLYARNYNPGREIPEPSRAVITALNRQALHAEILGFVHPITGEELRIVAKLPDDLVKLAQALTRNYG